MLQPCRPRRFLLLALVPLLAAAGCSSISDLRNPRERPEALDPVTVEASPTRAYDEALTLAFDQGYQIVYSDGADRLIELEALDRRVIGSDRVRRIDLFVREQEGQTRIHARVHSFQSGDPSAIGVDDDDREEARELLDRLAARLNGRRGDAAR